jgi:hypothetical protein
LFAGIGVGQFANAQAARGSVINGNILTRMGVFTMKADESRLGNGPEPKETGERGNDKK